MTGFKTIINFFNSKKSNKIFTRNEYFMALSKAKLKDSYKDTVRCYLVNAGYLKDIEAGVYRKLKPIPKDITLTQLQVEAYPTSDFAIGVASRRAKRNKTPIEYVP